MTPEWNTEQLPSGSVDPDLYSVQTAVVKYIREKRLSTELLKNLRLVDHQWKLAINRSVRSFRLYTENIFEGDPRLECLKQFPFLKALVLETEPEQDLVDNLSILRELPQLASLTLIGFGDLDVHLDATLMHMTLLQELSLKNPTEFTEDGLRMISFMPCLTAFFWTTASTDIPQFPQDIRDGFPRLERLEIKLDGAYAQLDMQGILNLSSLKSLKLTVARSLNNVRVISSMTQLKSLVLPSPSVSRSEQPYLSQMTQLTRLEFMTGVIHLPIWLKHFELLKHLTIRWRFSAEAGYLIKDCLPSSLLYLSLNTFQGPLKRSVFANLTSLKKLSLSYANQVDDHDDGHAFQTLVNMEELLVCRVSFAKASRLPNIHHLTYVKKLYLETNGKVDEDTVPTLALHLKALQHLTLGIDFNDQDLASVATMSNLESLTLQHSMHWTSDGLSCLSRLSKLIDLCMYFCGTAVTHEFVDYLWKLESLVHFGVFPIDEQCIIDLPSKIDDGFRVLTIDNDCKLDERFE